jgi:DNA-binding Lrp family transcriptional regulator
MSGGYDYLLRVTTPDLEAYNRFLRIKLLRLGCVDHVETNFALERVLYSTTLPLEHLETSS